MTPIEIEQAISELAERDFDPADFAYAFLEAFGNKATTIKRLKSGGTNASDIEGGVLQRGKIHIAVCGAGRVSETLARLKQSPATRKGKARFVVATDGIDFEAEDFDSPDSPLACSFAAFPDHFGLFLPLAGITTVRQIRENTFDIRATGRLNRLYIQLLTDNPEWGSAARRHDMNHFMARLIFCFFAEDTDIFNGSDLFTNTITRMGAGDASGTHDVLRDIFRALATSIADRAAARLPRWADAFPYVNGGLFSGDLDVPRVGRLARAHLIHIGGLDWTQINPDIFGSMIQAVTDEEERGALGLHYTSVPNILKVLNPLFLDDLRAALEAAAGSPRKLAGLRRRLAGIRVFDPACGSGNFLVISYKEMRAIEAEINTRLGEKQRRSEIPLTNFRGIELRDFPAEIARLALIIAEYQCDVLHRGQQEALKEFLPLDAVNWILCDNALRRDWLEICPPTGTDVKYRADDLFDRPEGRAGVDFRNEGGETYICGNPPYRGSTWQSKEQKADLEAIFEGKTKNWKSLDYVAGWFMKAADFGLQAASAAAFVSTNSICQGQQVPILWPLIFRTGHEIAFAHTSFKWANLASHNAGVVVVIVGISKSPGTTRKLYYRDIDKQDRVRTVKNINPYLMAGANVLVKKKARPANGLAEMSFGNKSVDGGWFFFNQDEKNMLLQAYPESASLIRPYSNSDEYINGKSRYCLWITDDALSLAQSIEPVKNRLDMVSQERAKSRKKQTVELARYPHRFSEIRHKDSRMTIVVPIVSSENREYLPVGLVEKGTIVGAKNFALYDAPLWHLALIASRTHWVWIGTVCMRLGMSFSYSNTLGWNTFPVPTLTEKNRDDLARSAEAILLAREAHFPATIAELYDPANMPENLRHAHERNDEVLERIYIGRRFRNDTERLEKLFDMYTDMTAASGTTGK